MSQINLITNSISHTGNPFLFTLALTSWIYRACYPGKSLPDEPFPVVNIAPDLTVPVIFWDPFLHMHSPRIITRGGRTMACRSESKARLIVMIWEKWLYWYIYFPAICIFLNMDFFNDARHKMKCKVIGEVEPLSRRSNPKFTPISNGIQWY